MSLSLLTLILFLFGFGFSQTLYVAVASSMRPPVEELARLFEKENPGVSLKLSYSSSGNLYGQILGGAPYHVFLSASKVYADKLHERGVAGKPVVVAYGKLVLFSLDRKPTGISDLLKYERIALANPRHAPYGKSAMEFLKRAGLLDSLRERLIYGSNVAQAFQFVMAGGADTGIVSLSLAVAVGEGYYWVVPKELYTPIEHTVVLTEKGLENPLAKKFLDYLTSKEAKSVFSRFGFGVP